MASPTYPRDVFIFAVSGSVRTAASNTALLDAAARLAPAGMVIERYPTVAVLPHFDPDLDTVDDSLLPAVVVDLRNRVGRADALLLSTPEYAHGLPGSFKNALDWLVGSVELPNKHTMVLSPSARGVYAQAQLREILTTMSVRLVEPVPVVVPLSSREMTVDEIVADAQLTTVVRNGLAALMDAVCR